VLTPAMRSFRIAIDYFEIEVEDAITPANLGFTLDGCELARDPYFCAQISGTLLDPNDPLGGFADIVAVTPVAMNLSAYASRGLDLSADWVRDFDFGTLSTRVLASRMIEQLVQPSAASPLLRDVSGVTGRHYSGFDWQPAADWAAQWIGTFSRGPFRVTAQMRYVSDGRKDYERTGPDEGGFDADAPNSIDDNRMPSYTLLALAGSYSFVRRGTRIELSGAVQNLPDKEPPLSGLGIAGTNPVFYDTVGRTYRIGVSASF
jgi:iron complex outermembrane recepter protein